MSGREPRDPGDLIDAAALATGIRQLLERPDDRRELGRRGRERIEQRYSWRRIAEATAQVYASVLAERSGRPARTTTSASAGTLRANQSSPSSAA